MTQTSSLMDLLACPRCHGKLTRVPEPEGLACERCKVLYAIEDGLPNMLIEDAKPWPDPSASGARA